MARKFVTSSSRFGVPLFWSTPQGSGSVLGVLEHWTALSRNRWGRLLSPNGTPSVISTTALTWQETQSGLLAPVGAVNAGLIQMSLEVPPVNKVWYSLLSPVRNWPTLNIVSASGVATAFELSPNEMPRTAVISDACCVWVADPVQVVTLQSGIIPLEMKAPPSWRPAIPTEVAGTSALLTFNGSYATTPSRTGVAVVDWREMKSVRALRAIRYFGG